jgi:hypothetical protein
VNIHSRTGDIQADAQGLLPDDLIRTFGDIDAPSGRGLTAIGALVIRSEGVSVYQYTSSAQHLSLTSARAV